MNQREKRKVLLASLIGNSIEWYDYLLYGTASALVFNHLFFKSGDIMVSTMLAFLTFALPFFIRPIGGVIFSHIGDKVGRKKTLVITLMIMGISTIFIGLLPTYDQIGVWAPILLVTIRIIQGLGIGGEWGGSLLLAIENADKKEKGFFGSVPQMGITIGMLLGTVAMALVTSLTTEEQFMSWGWRIPFLFSFVLVVVGLWIRKDIEESPVFQELQKEGKISKVPVVDTFKKHWKEVLIGTGLKVVETAPFYLLSGFVIYYATTVLKLDKTGVLNAVSIAALVATILIPLMGKWSDKIGYKKMYTVGTILMLLYAFPYYMMLNQGSILMVTIATIIGFGIIWAPITAVLGTLYSEIFSAEVRYTGVTLGYQLGAAFAGGTAPLIATALLSAYSNSWIPVAIYFAGTALISLISILLVKEQKEN